MHAGPPLPSARQYLYKVGRVGGGCCREEVVDNKLQGMPGPLQTDTRGDRGSRYILKTQLASGIYLLDGTCTFIYLARRQSASGYPWSDLSSSQLWRTQILPSNRPFEIPVGGDQFYLIIIITTPPITLQD